MFRGRGRRYLRIPAKVALESFRIAYPEFEGSGKTALSALLLKSREEPDKLFSQWTQSAPNYKAFQLLWDLEMGLLSNASWEYADGRRSKVHVFSPSLGILCGASPYSRFPSPSPSDMLLEPFEVTSNMCRKCKRIIENVRRY